MIYMFLRRKWIYLTVIIGIVLVLSACSNENASDSEKEGENEKSATEDNGPIALSDALEKYDVWYEVELEEDMDKFDDSYEDITRESKIKNIYIFKDGEVNGYSSLRSSFDDLEEIVGKSDEKAVKEMLKKEKNEIEEAKDIYEDEDTDKITPDFYNGDDSALNKIVEDGDIKSMSTAEEYSLDLGFDDQGQEIETESVITSEEIENTDDLTNHALTDVEDKSFNTDLFDETFAGLYTGEHNAVLTRVEDESVEFELDNEDDVGDNITIEKD